MSLGRRLAIWLAPIAVFAGVFLMLARPRPSRVEVGAVAPDFRVVNVATGKTVTLRTEYRDAVTLVNIWGTWCGPCVHEMPAMDSLFRALGSRGFRIAAVSVDERALDDVRTFVAAHQISFDVLNDASGRIKEIYHTTGVPESFLIDRTGHIVRIAQMAAPWNSPENRRIVEQLLAAPAS